MDVSALRFDQSSKKGTDKDGKGKGNGWTNKRRRMDEQVKDWTSKGKDWTSDHNKDTNNGQGKSDAQKSSSGH